MIDDFDNNTDCPHVGHELIAKAVKEKLPKEEDISNMSEFFSLLSDNTRLKIMMCLEISEMCVRCISDALGMSDSAVSHQLRILRESDFVKSRREGKFVYYSLKDNQVQSIIDTAAEHISEGGK